MQPGAYSMVASHMRGKGGDDIIFAIDKEARQAVEKYGKERVINATVGAIYNDNEELAVLPTVEKVFRQIPKIDIAAYAPIAGMPDFLEATIDLAFGEARPDAYITAVATPGGSGALRQAVWNYSEVGETILTATPYWGPYKTIAEVNLRKLATFPMFDEEGNFPLPAFRAKVHEILSRQDSLLILMNLPTHNPTGFAIEFEEWEAVVEVLKEAAQDTAKRIALFTDVAYIEYAADPRESKRFLKLFQNLPVNILLIVGYSMSKGFTIYGLRTGAMIGVSSSKEIAQEFRDVNEFANRAVWSSIARCGMRLITEIYQDKALLAQVEKERAELRKLLFERSSLFVQEAKEAGLKICPYKAGFFITVPAADPMGVVEKLKQENIFTVPLEDGIRIAICSLPVFKARGMAAKIKKAMD